MTEVPPRQHEEPMCIRVWLEVGHACEPRQTSSGRALSLDWRVWVRGARGDISAFVHKVVFHLHPPSAFVYPKRVLQEPPYEIKESGCASIDIPIHVYLKFSDKPKKICLRYSLHIENNHKANSESRCVYYDFENPSETLLQALMKGGGEVIARTGGFDHADKLVVLLPADERPALTVKKYKYVKPVRCKHRAERPAEPRAPDETCPKCGESMTAELRRQLRAAAMTDDEIARVSQLYLAYSGHDGAADALRLPPLSDPIYRPPELPPSLRGALVSVEADYAMQ